MRNALIAFAYAKVFRVYHRQITGTEPVLLHFGLTMVTQARLHAAIMLRLSNTFSFDDVYLALLLEDFDQEPDPVDDRGKLLPAALPLSSRTECTLSACISPVVGWMHDTFPSRGKPSLERIF